MNTNSIVKTMIKQKYIITKDGDSHWYLIPLHLSEIFDDWVDTVNEYKDTDIDFNSYRIDYPEQVIITEYEIKW